MCRKLKKKRSSNSNYVEVNVVKDDFECQSRRLLTVILNLLTLPVGFGMRININLTFGLGRRPCW